LERLFKKETQGLRYSEHVLTDGPRFREHACKLGLEGVISKRIDRPYAPTVRGSIPNRRAASRRLNPSIRTAWRTRPYNSTPLIPPPSALRAKSYLPMHSCSGATEIPGRFNEGFYLRRLQRVTVKAVSEVIWGMLEQKEALISARKISR
jgi:hypothetical protein